LSGDITFVLGGIDDKRGEVHDLFLIDVLIINRLSAEERRGQENTR
jgi:hypothetical protein